MKRLFRSKRRTLLTLFLVVFLIVIFYNFRQNFATEFLSNKLNDVNPKFKDLHDSLNSKSMKLEEKYDKPENFQKANNLPINYNVHAFYYAWYGNPEFDEKYLHWNHKFLPHWEKRISRLYSTGESHIPPDDLGSNFYPFLGAYSSKDPKIIHSHMQQIARAGIGVLSLSWYPDGKADDQGLPAEHFILCIFEIADLYNIKICFHIEPYKGRNAVTVGKDIKFILKKYGDNPAFYRTNDPRTGDKNLPLIYVYDSYLTSPVEWSQLLKKGGSFSIRETNNDAIVIGLLVESKHRDDIAKGGFDGFYTYFASDGFSYGSTWKSWKDLTLFAKNNKLIFIPSVGPGYIDTNVRPWNGRNTKQRLGGKYYETSWKNAIDSKPNFISITSFNEWHEGTQIEPAMHKKSTMVKNMLGKPRSGNFTYEDYGHDPNLYLSLTKKWILEFEKL